MNDTLNESDAPAADSGFAGLGLIPELMAAVERLGWTEATPIQARTIPVLLAGRDVLGQAQTGTGKTAAFGLPILQRIDLADRRVQALVLAPTRELAVQVAEMIEALGRDLGNVGVLAIYGGDPIDRQIRRLQSGVRVVVGTPGRILDHLGRGTLNLEAVRIAVLDEGDEMLRMGFLEDVEAILAQVPKPRQMALFSATLPREITAIGRRHLVHPEAISVPAEALTVENVDQQYLVVEPDERLEALARLLAVEDAQAALVFARTRAGCAELAELLEARGIPTEALHGDLPQLARQSVLRRLKRGQLRILVATDVAARGLDIEHVDLVVNLSFPSDPGLYVHRIGRTARAGRHGRAVLLVTPHEERRLRELERFIGHRLTRRQVPTAHAVQAAQLQRFAQVVRRGLTGAESEPFRPLADELLVDASPRDLVAALLRLAWGDRPLPVELPEPPPPPRPTIAARPARPAARTDEQTGFSAGRRPRAPLASALLGTNPGFTVLSMGVGRRNGVEPRGIVGAIANEAGVPGSVVGAIDIRSNYTLVEVRAEAAPLVIERMQKTLLCGRYLQPREATAELLALPESTDLDRPSPPDDGPRSAPRRRAGSEPLRPAPRSGR